MWTISKAYGGFVVIQYNRGNASPIVNSAYLTQAAAVAKRNTLNP